MNDHSKGNRKYFEKMRKTLLIHTALGEAIIALASDDRLIEVLHNNNPKEHSSFLHKGIQQLLRNNNLKPGDITLIGTTTGPGSYTGIRIGIAAAKGLSFALGIPIVGCSMLELIVRTAMEQTQFREVFWVPVIHARQQEFYYGIYSERGEPIHPEGLINLKEDRFPEIQENQCFTGLRQEEAALRKEVPGSDPVFVESISAQAFLQLVLHKYKSGKSVDAAGLLPNYLKEAFTTSPKSL
ncbi:MAG: tRNA (adenosine(37)-N6)-threonylcarbamoyltransferase complex dimerization subunit type 1 TsaB [Chitinophagaceae bacterium]|nr:tRNA (adenosine(37)-N6)-threonylcarbamoyltransferase complex dimerization subunit type 1 TsaB [Chitinophagaceae bacterium]